MNTITELKKPVWSDDLYCALVNGGIIPAGGYTHIEVSAAVGELARISLITDYPRLKAEKGIGS